MRRLTRAWPAWLLGGACAACLAVAISAGAHQAARPPAKTTAEPGATSDGATSDGAAVAGRVTVAKGQKVPEMIVYLESTDPEYTFEPPEGPPLVVSQRDAKFEPSLLVVPVGTRVDFHNNETKLAHNVFSNSQTKKFDLGLYAPGQKVEPVHFDKPGAVRLRCSIHRFMDGVVYVTPTPYHAVVGEDGKFAMKGVRAGAYRLKTWQRTKRYRDQDVAVTVEAGKPVPDVTVTLGK